MQDRNNTGGIMAVTVEPALSPHLTVDDAAAAIDFYVKAFGAVEVGRVPRADGKLIHAAVRINGRSTLFQQRSTDCCGSTRPTKCLRRR